jgi:ribonuclease T2
MKKVVITCVLLLGLIGGLPAQSRKRDEPRGEAGVFDFYVLSLSWSPQYCAQTKGNKDEVQCAPGRRFGFVVHGLWPQYERGWPQNCATGGQVHVALAQRMLPLMPSRQLIQHEWQKHGTCSGLPQEEYFRTIEKVFGQLHIPAEFKSPATTLTVHPQEIKRKFSAANSTLPETAMRVLCSGRFLSEVRLCYTRQLQPRPCSADLRDSCRSDPVILPPVR